MNNNQIYEWRLPILTYHSIDDSGSVISVTPKKFHDHLQHLMSVSFNVLTLQEVSTNLIKKQKPPPKSVVITFDDGIKNFYHQAYPLLREFGFSATVFLVAGYCGRNNQWHGQPRAIPVFDLLDWDEIEEMSNRGIDFGAHTLSHPDLSKLSLEEARQEIINSKLEVQGHLGKDVLFFAYPYGKSNSLIETIVKDQFNGACSTELGFVCPRSNVYALPRIDMYYFSRNSLFKWFGTPLFFLFIRCCRALRSMASCLRNTRG